MKNQRAMIVMAVAVVLGLVAVAMAWRWMNNHQLNTADRIVVASAEMSMGQRLPPEVLLELGHPGAQRLVAGGEDADREQAGVRVV